MRFQFLVFSLGLLPFSFLFAEDLRCVDTRLKNSGFEMVFSGVGTKTPQVNLRLPVGKTRIENFEGNCRQPADDLSPTLLCEISTTSGNYLATLTGDSEKKVSIQKQDSTLEPLNLNCDN